MLPLGLGLGMIDHESGTAVAVPTCATTPPSTPAMSTQQMTMGTRIFRVALPDRLTLACITSSARKLLAR